MRAEARVAGGERRSRSGLMLPREHGAYGQLLFPLVTALSIGRPGTAAFALAAAGVAIFLTHEPLLVVTGGRGARAAREETSRAWRWLMLFGALGVACGLAGILTASWSARLALLVPSVLAVGLLKLIVNGREHTAGGEFLTAVTLSSLSMPIALAASAAPIAAWTCAAVFATGFVVATGCVRAMILGLRQERPRLRRPVAALAAVLAVVVLHVLARAGVLAGAARWAAAPMCLVGFALAAIAPPPRYVRYAGWSLVVATGSSAAMLISGLR